MVRIDELRETMESLFKKTSTKLEKLVSGQKATLEQKYDEII